MPGAPLAELISAGRKRVGGAQHEARRGCWAPIPLFGSSHVFLKTYFSITADIHYYVTFRCTT